MIITRIAMRTGMNLNWIFDPVTAWRRKEPLDIFCKFGIYGKNPEVMTWTALPHG
ncbi:hypothetical protein H4P12_00180 [Paracoccus sp. 11-3]|uniref:Uncharacterized protein n=1 Tax=Paracoccus amoyensis TaxID=2760093 RepID=A0A926G5X5_9RHOB|nr:hypothetical protein [Paracoccus amoyensis]